MRRFAAVLLIAALPGVAHAVDAPGLGLDNPGLQDLDLGRYGLGFVASVKGARLASSPASSDVAGAIKIGKLDDPRNLYVGFPSPYGNAPTFAAGLSSTLVPPFAAGAVLHATNGPATQGPFVQAIIYEPDEVKRKGASGEKSRIQLKQKSYVAIRFGRFGGTGLNYIPNPTTIFGGLQVEACRAQAEITNNPKKTPPIAAKFKVKCSGKSTEVQRVKAALEAVLGKAKSGFDLKAVAN